MICDFSGESKYRGSVRGCFSESAELRETPYQPVVILDRYRYRTRYTLVDVGGRRHEDIGDQFDYPFIVAPVVVRLRESARRHHAELYVSEKLGDRRRTATGYERLVQLTELVVDVGYSRADMPASALVVQSRGDGLGLVQALQCLAGLSELAQHRAQLD